MEETDAGETCCSGLEAGGGVFQGDSAERTDRRGSGGEAGGAQTVESLAGEGGLAGEGFFKDGSEEDGVDAMVAGAGNLGYRVAGDGNDRRRQASGGVEGADLSGGEFARSGGQVDPVGTCGDGDVRAGVDQKLCRHGC